MQLGQPEVVGAFDDQRVGVGDVEPAFDDRRADQDVVLPLPEREHVAFEGVLVHLPVRRGDARLGHQLAQPGRGLLDGLDPVVDVEDLAVAQQLAPDRGGDLLVVVDADERQHRVAFLGRGVDRRQLADAGDRHLQRARDRGRAHREHVHRGAHLLEQLLVLDAEALLLIDDDQAEVLELGARLTAAGGCR